MTTRTGEKVNIQSLSEVVCFVCLFACFYEVLWRLIKRIKPEKFQGRAEQTSQIEDGAPTGNT